MKKSFLLLLIIAASAHAQKKYQSLLWEISGNGLTQNSYLYGSMHVSEKVSYHLSDSFFKYLLAADFVANESDPSSWIDIYDVINRNPGYNDPHFYAAFYQQPLKKEQLYPLFISNNYTMNNILFRTNDNQQDYQEDTYLDMFIHQTGKKYHKKTVGLENAKTSLISIMNMESQQMKPSDENIQAIMKLLKEKSFNQALLDYYRDKNLDMIDSIYSLAAPEKYLKTMLYDRNVTMTNSIDSLAHKGSLFAAIGAAHLPGKNGVIESLRKKGYTVTPIIDAYTEKGRSIKKEIDDYFIKPAFEQKTTADGMVQLPMNPQPIYNGDAISTPDLTNGGIINLKRVLLRNYLRKDGQAFDPKTLDSLFYENIPGEILSKKFFKEDNYSGYDIRNRTKTGNSQHYKYYVTPLEIIAVSMSGNGDYVNRYENEIFDRISVAKQTSEWQNIEPLKGGFSVTAPGYHVLYGNRIGSNPDDVELNAFDANANSYYFIEEHTLNDTESFEDAQFEAKRIQDEYYTQIGATDATGTQTLSGYESNAKLGTKNIGLKTVISGPKYYLLGTVSATPTDTQRFFTSFKTTAFNYSEERRVFNDTTAHFSISVPVKQNEKMFWKSAFKPKKYDPNDRQNLFIGNTNTYTIKSASGKEVSLRFLQYHRYASEKNIDSVWSYYRSKIRQDNADANYVDAYDQDSVPTLEDPEMYSKKGFAPSTWDKELNTAPQPIELYDEKITYNQEQQYYQMDLMATTATASQAAKYRIIFKNGLCYELAALVDKHYKKQDAFIEETYNSFRLKSPLMENSVFDDKTSLFINDAKSEQDSIRYSALQSVYMLNPSQNDLPELKKFLTEFKFRPDEIVQQTELLEKIGGIDDPDVIPFLESQYKSSENTIVQFAVLRALANQKSKAAYRKILDLLNYDLPLSDNQYEISGIFSIFQDDLANSHVLFPGIFQFFNIDEYHDPVIELTNALLDQDLINPKKLSSYKKMILTNAKLEYKRVASWKSNSESQDEDNSDNETAPVEDLISYINLIMDFKNEKAVDALLQKVTALDIPQINLELARLEIVKRGNLNPELQKALLTNSKTAFPAFILLENAKLNQFTKPLTDVEIAKSAMEYFDNVDVEKDSILPLQTKIIPLGNREITFFFYKIVSSQPAKNYGDYSLGRITAVAFANDKNRIDPKAFKSIQSQTITDADEIPSQIDAMIDEAINEKRHRATFGKIGRGQNSYSATEDY